MTRRREYFTTVPHCERRGRDQSQLNLLQQHHDLVGIHLAVHELNIHLSGLAIFVGFGDRPKLTYAVELDINLEILFHAERNHLYPHFAWHSPVDIAQYRTPLSTLPDAMKSIFLELVPVVEKAFDAGMPRVVQEILAGLHPWRLSDNFPFFQVTSWDASFGSVQDDQDKAAVSFSYLDAGLADA